MFLVIFFFLLAVLGAALTAGRNPILNPRTVRLSDKLKHPFSRPNPDLLTIEPEAYPALGLYLLGTDEFGRDVAARMLEGAWVSLSVGFVAVGISVVVGIFFGALAGYYGGRIDGIIMRFVDVMLCFPSMFLILTIIAVRPPSLWNVMFVIGITSWMGTCRFVRGEFLSLREREYIHAATLLGASPWRIMSRHLLPNSLAPVFVSTNLGIAGAILLESSLSYLGFGVPPPHATWGNILSDGKTYLFDAPHLTYVPGIAIFLTVLAFNLFGEGLREASNVKLRQS